MEYIDGELTFALFTRTNLPLTSPIVVHGVPGCGKSRLIKNLVRKYHFSAQTFGEPSEPDLEGVGIQSYSGVLAEGFNLLDEYLSGESELEFDVIFSDPHQNCRLARRAHYTCNITRRFGEEICAFLRSLSFDIVSACPHPSSLVVENIFNGTIEGQVIAFEKPVVELLQRHNCPFVHLCDCRGSQFEVVTFVTSSRDLQTIVGANLYISLTRATHKLKILKPDEFE